MRATRCWTHSREAARPGKPLFGAVATPCLSSVTKPSTRSRLNVLSAPAGKFRASPEPRGPDEFHAEAPIPFPKHDGRWESRADSGSIDSASQQSLVCAEELAQILGIHAATVRRLARNRRIPSYRAGTALRFDVDQVKRALHQEAVSHGSQVRNPKGGIGPIRASSPSEATSKDEAVLRDSRRGQAVPRAALRGAARSVANGDDELEQRIARAARLVPLSDAD